MERWSKVNEQIINVFYTSVWKRHWPLWAGAVALALVNIFMFAYARGIGVFPQMAMWGSWIYNLLGIEVDAPFVGVPLKLPHLDIHSAINFGIILGVLMAALLSREFKIRTEDWRGYLAAIVGGVLMGFGTVITPPCNVGGFYSATMALSLSGPLMALGLLTGAYLGGRFLEWEVTKSAEGVDFSTAPQGEPVANVKTSLQPFFGMMVGILLVAVAFIRL